MSAEKLITCTICGEETHKELDKYDYVLASGEPVCSTCYDEHYCSCCEEAHNEEMYDIGGDIICKDCRCNNYSPCDNCDRLVQNSYIRYSEHDEEYYCDACYDELFDGEGGRYSYSWNYYGTDSRLYYGIELEVGSFSYMGLKSMFNNSLSDFFDIHSDGSILNDGDGVMDEAEIVSHPATYKYLMEHKSLWDDVLNTRNKGVVSFKTNTCGMHIHLSRDYFTEEHLYKLLQMIYGQPSFSYLISQRQICTLNEWGSLKPKRYSQDGEYKKYTKQLLKAKVARYTAGHDRYEAVNLTNSNTIELRLFRGTMNPTAFWKNIEYTHAMVNFTEATPTRNLTLKNFMAFIIKNKTDFPNLHKWLVKRTKELQEKPQKSIKRIMTHLKSIR